jgi:hypothetical protein
VSYDTMRPKFSSRESVDTLVTMEPPTVENISVKTRDPCYDFKKAFAEIMLLLTQNCTIKMPFLRRKSAKMATTAEKAIITLTPSRRQAKP